MDEFIALGDRQILRMCPVGRVVGGDVNGRSFNDTHEFRLFDVERGVYCTHCLVEIHGHEMKAYYEAQS